jgi:hypothetical protein
MKKLFTLLAIVGLGLTSCEKDETVKAKDYKNYVVEANLNSIDGKEVTNPHTGITGKQYYYSVQYNFNLSDNDISEGIVNSSDKYDNIVLPKDPANSNNLTEKLPENGDWEILLSQYVSEVSYLDEGVTKYQKYGVVGVMINQDKNIEVSNIKDNKFDSITLEEAKTATFKDDVDAIGYDWKELDFATFSYKIVTDNYYLVKLSNGDIYKLKFEDFYGENPYDNPKETKDFLKGHIKFQFQLLK